jgi:hypothetical protein
MNLESSEVITKKIVNPEYIANYVLVWDKQRKLPTAAEKFVEYVRDEWTEN